MMGMSENAYFASWLGIYAASSLATTLLMALITTFLGVFPGSNLVLIWAMFFFYALFLNLSSVREDEFGQLGGGGGSEDWTAKTQTIEPWEQSTMIEVGVGQNNKIYFGGVTVTIFEL